MNRMTYEEAQKVFGNAVQRTIAAVVSRNADAKREARAAMEADLAGTGWTQRELAEEATRRLAHS